MKIIHAIVFSSSIILLTAHEVNAQGIPDLSQYDGVTRQSIYMACSYEKTQGPAKYTRCLNKQIKSIQGSEISDPSVSKPTTARSSRMVLRVQAILLGLDYFNGDIDGVLGPQTRTSLKKYQKDKGLTQTGRMDIETLTALGIAIP